MTMKIEVTVPEAEIQGGGAAHYLAAAMSALGFSRGVTLPLPITTHVPRGGVTPLSADAGLGEAMAASPASGEWAAEPPAHAAPAGAEAPKRERERGKPSPGRARRTKEEIAEDEAADKADALLAEGREIPDEKPLISSGEERIDPTTEEDATQDAADEAAEAEATKPAELTHDDVRAALQKYLTAFGTPAAMEDGPKVLTMMFGAEVTKVSAVPSDQASLAKAVAGIEEMLVKNPFKREAQL